MKYIDENSLKSICSDINGEYGLFVSIPETNEKFTLNEHKKFNAASTIKIPILALLLKDFEEGRLDKNELYPLSDVNNVLGSGVLKSLSKNFRLSLYDYAVLMMIVSDNSATNEIIDAVGIDRANEFFASNGWNETHLAGKLYSKKPLLPDGSEDYNSTSAADLGDMMERVLFGTMVSESVSRQMMQIMAAQQYGKFNLSIPVERFSRTLEELPPVPEGRVIMANKGGSLMGKVLHDAAIMLLPNGRKAVMTMMTATPDNSITTEQFKRVSKTLYDAMIK